MTAQLSCYREGDADSQALAGQRVVVAGYGNLGRPMALNLRDEGVEVLVASRPDGDGERAAAEGFTVLPLEEGIAAGDVVWLALPDEVIPELLAPTAPTRPAPGSLVCLSSGYVLAYELVKLPDDVDAVLLAPRMLGARLRPLYLSGEGFYSFVSVEQDATGTAERRLLALARAVGALKRGGFRCSAAEEAALDLFVEQSVGPQLGAALLAAFEVGTAQGLPPEALALELHMSGEMAATWQAFADHGFFAGVRLHGHTSAFGGFVRLGDIDVEAMKRRFADTLEDIRSGRFARRFQEELAAGSPTSELIDAMVSGDDPLSRAEAAVRGACGD